MRTTSIEKIYLTGVGCVGKSTVGEILARLMNYSFFDLDKEIEKFFGTSISRIKSRFLTEHSFREETSGALRELLLKTSDTSCIIALPPSGFEAKAKAIL